MLELPLPDGVSGYEFVDGRPVPVSLASILHSRLMSRVHIRLGNYVEQHGSGGEVLPEAGFVLGLQRDPERMRGPDIAYVTEDSLRRHGDPGPRLAHFAPDLAIEIDVHGPRKQGGLQRVRDYLEAGVRLVWTIEPRTRSATVYRQDGSVAELSERDALDGEEVVPGFRLPLDELFR
jgi:Uma2 family endonuclease